MAWFSNLLAHFHHNSPPMPATTPQAAAAAAPAYVPPIPDAVDVIAGAFIDRDDFMKAIARSSIATYLDGRLVHNGIPGVNFYTQPDGSTISTMMPVALAIPAPSVSHVFDLPNFTPPPVPVRTPESLLWPDTDEHGLLKIPMIVAVARDAAVRASLGDETFKGTVDPATLSDANWCHYAVHPGLWPRATAIFSGTLSAYNASIDKWFAHGNKNAVPEAGPLPTT